LSLVDYLFQKKNHNQDHTPHREAKKYVQTAKIHIWIYES
jgi:hypothetical protein